MNGTLWYIEFTSGTKGEIEFYSNGTFHQKCGNYFGKWTKLGYTVLIKYNDIKLDNKRIILRGHLKQNLKIFRGKCRHSTYKNGILKFMARKTRDLKSREDIFPCSEDESTDFCESEGSKSEVSGIGGASVSVTSTNGITSVFINSGDAVESESEDSESQSSESEELNLEMDIHLNEIEFLMKNIKRYGTTAIEKIKTLYENNPSLPKKLIMNPTGFKYRKELFTPQETIKYVIKYNNPETIQWFIDNFDKVDQDTYQIMIKRIIDKQPEINNPKFKLTKQDIEDKNICVRWVIDNDLYQFDESIIETCFLDSDMIQLLISKNIIDTSAKTFKKVLCYIRRIKLAYLLDILKLFGPLTAEEMYDAFFQNDTYKKYWQKVLKFCIENNWFEQSLLLFNHFFKIDPCIHNLCILVPDDYQYTEEQVNTIVRRSRPQLILKCLNTLESLTQSQTCQYISTLSERFQDHDEIFQENKYKILDLYKTHILMEEMAPTGICGKLIIEKLKQNN